MEDEAVNLTISQVWPETSMIVGGLAVEFRMMHCTIEGTSLATAMIKATAPPSALPMGIAYLDPPKVFNTMKTDRALNGERFRLAEEGAAFALNNIACAVTKVVFDEKGGILEISVDVTPKVK